MVELSQTTVTIFVPLIFTVVMQLSALARSADSDGTLADLPPLFFPRGSRFVPSLGRLNLFHATNAALLAGCLVLVQAGPDPMLTILSLLVGFVWLQLPVLEVEEYATLSEEVYPVSLYFHVVATAATAAYATTVVDSWAVVRDLDELTLNPLSLLDARSLWPLAGLAACCLVSVVGFLHLLEWDLRARDGDRRRVERVLPAFRDDQQR